jgi:hypothetical protein
MVSPVQPSVAFPSKLTRNDFVSRLDQKNLRIFLLMPFLPEQLSEFATVSKQWKEVAYAVHAILQQGMSLENRCGAEAWQKNLGLTGLPHEPHVPMDFYKLKKFKLMLIPYQISVNHKNVVLNGSIFHDLFQNNIDFKDCNKIFSNGSCWMGYKEHKYSEDLNFRWRFHESEKTVIRKKNHSFFIS